MAIEDSEVPALPDNLFYIALIIDNEVVQVITASEKFYAMMMSNPVIKDVTGQTAIEGGIVQAGVIYNPETDTFAIPE
jgi:hypothetical protein